MNSLNLDYSLKPNSLNPADTVLVKPGYSLNPNFL